MCGESPSVAIVGPCGTGHLAHFRLAGWYRIFAGSKTYEILRLWPSRGPAWWAHKLNYADSGRRREVISKQTLA